MLNTGTTFTASVEVDDSNTALAVGSGDLDVFATPALVALMEKAAASLAAASLPEESTTVGAAIDISHLKPTAVGGTVTAKAILIVADGRKLSFRVEAFDKDGLVGEGTHTRHIVDRKRFMEKLNLNK